MGCDKETRLDCVCPFVKKHEADTSVPPPSYVVFTPVGIYPSIRTLSAEETKKVTACCASEALCTTLPVLFVELEKCQKSLEGYLEQKRSRFPRFYFVSNPVLLLVLSQGSDPVQMQPYYEKVFDSISQVVHDRK